MINETRQTELGQRVAIARSFWSRGKGLMFRSELPTGTGLVIDPCSSIHTFWMRFPIDVLYLDKNGTVLRADHAMKPWRIGPLFVRHGRFVIELPAGTIERSRTERGDHLRLDPISA
ncbi:MAG TPA: DUF192 domain-containing protein [Nitrolancea sp.]|nr:DUF192 domain-containing protein [Nitrolancea sp.]